MRRVIILGAGASRSVSYATIAKYPSPLDRDLFDLLQRRVVGTTSSSIRNAINRVLKRAYGLPTDYWRSMERAFYTLHLRAYLAKKIGNTDLKDTDAKVVRDFAIAIQALLRFAHEDRTCDHHRSLFQPLGYGDAIISFNYDLVPERALKAAFEKKDVKFGEWLYGLRLRLDKRYGPILLKLHGSSNWRLKGSKIIPRTKTWAQFDEEYGYLGHRGKGTTFPIFLPFWDKRIERKPWLTLWKLAHDKLIEATHVVVWGYSLPPTDVKAQELFLLGLGQKRKDAFRLCVIDPSDAVRVRWRSLFPRALWWEYPNYSEFQMSPPRWWR